ncbi:MAG TPA: NADH-quinone oxidoreductase subunit J [Terriglobia bacterium]|nr:NADH-quinone oxidoreductase subunit J [Terriglobia bacterium]
MHVLFYIAAAVAIFATLMMLTRLNAVHALLYLIVSLLAVAIVFFTIGAPFMAALEVIIYAGAIMVLFVFVVMLLNLGKRQVAQEKAWQRPGMWPGPVILAIILIIEVAFLVGRQGGAVIGAQAIGPKQVGIALFGPYLIGVELASFLLLGALVGAYHLGIRKQEKLEKRNDKHTHESGAAAGGDFIRAGADRPAGAP